MKLHEYRRSPAALIALLALFVSLGGVGVAATGNNFILGQANSAESKTALTAGINDKALAITNSNTGSNAGALSLTVASGKPPIVVSAGAGKATGLNADKLDGVDSNSFVRGTAGRIVSSHVVTAIDPNFPEKTILTVPGLGTLTAQCPNFNGVYVGFHHASSHWMAIDKHDGTDPVVIDATGTFTQLMSGKAGSDHWTLAIDQGSGPSALVATLDIYTEYGASDCTFQAQAIVTQGS
jgi:hypothetical protein